MNDHDPPSPEEWGWEKTPPVSSFTPVYSPLPPMSEQDDALTMVGPGGHNSQVLPR